MRVDDAHHIAGLRLNVWTAILVFLLAVTYLVLSAKKRPGREDVVEPGAVASGDDADGGEKSEGAGKDHEIADEDKAETEAEADAAEKTAKNEAGSGKKT
jgi:hypothetical protein